MEYQEKLNVLKSIAGGDGEAELIAAIIQKIKKTDQSEILEIGCGDGKFTNKYLKLVPDFQYALHLADIDPNALATASVRFPEAEIYSGLNELQHSRRFDIIVLVQSLYYLGPLSAVVKQIVERLRSSGIAIFVLWNENCDLFKIGKDQSHRKLLTAGDLVLELEKYDDTIHIDQVSNKGRVLHKILNELDPQKRNGLFELLRRGSPTNDDESNLQIYSDTLKKGEYTGKRENSVISAWRK